MNNILERVNSVCADVRRECAYPVSFKLLMSKTRRHFKKHKFDISLKTQRKKFLGPEEFYVNAYYDAEDDKNNETPIEVFVYHNFENTETWDYKHVTDVLIQVFDAVVHEYRHQRQSVKRHYAVYSEHTQAPYVNYLADPDELDAYALSITIELCRTMGKFRALNYMHRFTALSRFKIQNVYVSPNLHAYVSHFGGINDGLVKRLAKKVYIRLKKIDTDHIFV